MIAARTVLSRVLPRRGAPIAVVLVAAMTTLGLAAPAAAAQPERSAVIVQLEPGADPDAESRRAAAAGGNVRHVYRTVFAGFAGEFTEQALEGLRRNPRVALIEPDGVATKSAVTQSQPPWGLDRIDQRALPLSTSYTYPDAAGGGVVAYVLDTGIAAHPEFGNRLNPGFTSIADGRGTTDCDGHGTHVAGTLGAATYGVAKAVTLVPVRVLDCSGSGLISGVIAGVDWAAGNHPAGVRAVANMSLGTFANSSLDQAVVALINDGVSVAVAAGNSRAKACNYSPARVGAALTVGATDITDRRASFSNFGACLDMFAPGVGVESTWLNGSTAVLSGTSMASPHVAGAAALLLSTRSDVPTAATVASTLRSRATTGVVTAAGTRSPNRLLFVEPQ